MNEKSAAKVQLFIEMTRPAPHFRIFTLRHKPEIATKCDNHQPGCRMMIVRDAMLTRARTHVTEKHPHPAHPTHLAPPPAPPEGRGVWLLGWIYIHFC